jgi:DNA-binding NtrC family response regulator
MKDKILLVDDDAVFLKSLKKVLSLKKYAVDTAESAAQAEALLGANGYACILLDVKMPDVDDLDLLKTVLQKQPLTPVIMVSGGSNIEIAVDSLKVGAYDFFEKSVEWDRLLVMVKNAIHQKNLQEEKDSFSRALEENFRMIGASPLMHELFKRIEEVAKTSAKVLILGETGTGKELVARSIHHHSLRKGKPYLKLNCAAIPAELLESEIFGHRKGAFTGAISDRKGKFIEADGGTLFLDEIGDMSIHLQAKLLRVLEDNEVEMIGDNTPRQVDVRVIAATNKNLENLVEEGKFREDLYYRLNVFKISIPPLRERPEDILPLAHHFLKEFSEAHNKSVLSIKRRASALLLNYNWPGNVRELRNLIEKIVISTPAHEIDIDEVRHALEASKAHSWTSLPIAEEEIIELSRALQDFEKRYILSALDKYNWKIQETAKALGIDRSNLFKKMRKHGINK